MTYAAFDYADKERNPVLILADGVIGSILEPVVLPEQKSEEEVAAIKHSKDEWAAVGHELGKRAWINPGGWDNILYENCNKEADAMYKAWADEAEAELYMVEDAEVVLTAYGISARIAKSAVDALRAEGIKAGLVRAKTVFPFPYQAYDKINYDICKGIVDIEMSIPAQFVEDVQVAVNGRAPITTCLRSAGNMLSKGAIIEAAKEIVK